MNETDDLEPQRQIQLRMWMTENPKSSEVFFNEKIWPYFRANIIERRVHPIEVVPKPKQRKTAGNVLPKDRI